MCVGYRMLRRLPKIGFLLRIAATKNHQSEDIAAGLQLGKKRDSEHNKLSPRSDTSTIDHMDPSVFKRFQWIGNTAPCFSVSGSQIQVLNDPQEFYGALKKLAGSSRKRILLASLYLGTGKLEQELVDCIYDATSASEKAGGDLRVKFLFDYMRGSRGEKNSRTMVLPLLKEFEERVSIALYHTPDLRGIMKRILPERYNETVGVSHMKVYLFDDTIIMSGANLSESYFTDRQDRYVVIERCPALADFFEQTVTAVSSLSFQLLPNNELRLANELRFHPYLGSGHGSVYRKEMKKIVEETISNHRNYNELMTSRLFSQSEAKGHGSENTGHGSVNKDQSPAEVDTLIFPLVQMGPFNVRHDEIVTKALFERATLDVTICLASGYFNLTNHYMNSIVRNCKARFDILTAAPQANGFFGASGVSGSVPDAYTYIAKQFFEEVRRTGHDSRIALYEFLRPGWTVHAKGLWYYIRGQPLPVMTMIGSPNFGHRSVFRDLEAQVVIVTQNETLQKQLHKEQIQLYNYSTRVTSETFDQPVRRIPRWVTYVTPIIRNFF